MCVTLSGVAADRGSVLVPAPEDIDARRTTPRPIPVDPHRNFIFPNQIREYRLKNGERTILGFSKRIAEIPYIRLSKIERGEVVARPREMRLIAAALQIADPKALLVDLDDPGFSLDAWAASYLDVKSFDREEEQFSVLLGAMFRALRSGEPSLTIAALEERYGLPPVVLSRIENAKKTFDRWNGPTQNVICRIFGAEDAGGLRKLVWDRYRNGDLDEHLSSVSSIRKRESQIRERMASLREKLLQDIDGGTQAESSVERQGPIEGTAPADPAPSEPLRYLRISGRPLPAGLISDVATSDVVEAPATAGPQAYALRVSRPTLGLGLPATSICIVDPDVYPSAGDLCVVQFNEGFRILAVVQGRDGSMQGCSLSPEFEVALDDLDPARVAGVIAAYFR